ncbi:NADH-quinone oxidoreductase subunit NuoE [Thalassomonas sp. M1454]|uniref:NADH-quinone oxidoreductase subunit NuoE n=1 Tax=Thalassomonas sp. M1454 TaxID=2594477 RepID=UPI001180F6CF|nr:NADH-quinone oxidoreductase subunit NuoE [Thalassomonas sp. M1454]TRX55756.1 NADH-quinone oxidoreductase subunit NuoE [Thalassomonas sp. M1454]
MTLASLKYQQINTVNIDYRTYLSAGEIAAIEHETTLLEYREAAGIEALKIVQNNRGWISDDSLFAIANLLQMPVSQLEGVATFYNLIYRQPVGKYVIHLCDSISCYLTGFETIADYLQQELGIGFGQTSSDGLFTLLTNACLGGCDKGPTMMIDGKHYQHLTVDAVQTILVELTNSANGLTEGEQ